MERITWDPFLWHIGASRRRLMNSHEDKYGRTAMSLDHSKRAPYLIAQYSVAYAMIAVQSKCDGNWLSYARVLNCMTYIHCPLIQRFVVPTYPLSPDSAKTPTLPAKVYFCMHGLIRPYVISSQFMWENGSGKKTLSEGFQKAGVWMLSSGALGLYEPCHRSSSITGKRDERLRRT